MSNPTGGQDAGSEGGTGSTLYKKDFWSEENLKYVRPHYRMEKVSRLINRLAKDRAADPPRRRLRARYAEVPLAAQYRVLRHRHRHTRPGSEPNRGRFPRAADQVR